MRRESELHRKFMELIAMDAAAKAKEGGSSERKDACGTVIHIAEGCQVFFMMAPGPVTVSQSVSIATEKGAEDSDEG